MKANNTQPFFSKTIFFYLCILILSVPFWQGCKPKPVVVIRSKVVAVQAIALLDVNNGPLRNVHAAKITLIDSGKMILSSNGFPFETLVLNEGFMSVGLSPKAQFSIARPYRFSIRVEAAGYMTTVRSIVITDSTPNYTPIYLVKPESLPPGGLAASTGNITAISNGTITQTQFLNTIFRQGNGDTLSIKIPDGTQLLSGRKPVQTKGDLAYRILLGKPRDSIANLVFPGGFEVTDAINEEGKKLADAANPIFFTTAGWFSMEMNIGNTIVDGFSRPLDVEIPIADTVINPITKRIVHAGDSIPLWSLDNRTGKWKLESMAVVLASGSGDLKTRIQINHLSTFNLDFTTGQCTNAIHVQFDNSKFSGDHLTDYIDVSNNAIIKQKVVNFSASPLDVLRSPSAITGKLYVHAGTDPTTQGIGVSNPLNCSQPTAGCPPSATANCLGELGSTSFPCVTLKFIDEANNLYCANSVWVENAPGTFNYYLYSGTLNVGLINIPEPTTSGPSKFLLWYMTSSGSISLRFEIDLADNSQPGRVFNNATNALVGSVNYTIDPPNGETPCGKLIQITIPNTLISNLGLSCQ